MLLRIIVCAAGGRTGAVRRPKRMEQPGRNLPGCFFLTSRTISPRKNRRSGRSGGLFIQFSVGPRLQRMARNAQQRRQQQREHDAFAHADDQPQRQRAEHKHR